MPAQDSPADGAIAMPSVLASPVSSRLEERQQELTDE